MLQTEPDAIFGRRVRFTCGALLGLVLALWLHLYVGPFRISTAALLLVLSTIACGVLAMRYGDEFWRAMISIFRG
jgi:hypothetical protein